MPIFSVPLADLRRRTSIKWTRFEPDVLPMFVAEMDVHLAEPIAERLRRAIDDGDTGYPELPMYQESFAGFAEWMWGWRVDPGRDVHLAGDVMQGMRETLLLVTEPGDGVVVNPPIYPPFYSVVARTGRRRIDVPLTTDGRLDLDAIEAAFVANRPRAYLLCSPHNPSGAIHTREELTRLARLAQEHGVTIISDEIHAPLAGDRHVPLLAIPEARDCFVVTSASKSWNLAALKAGLIVAGEGAREKLGTLPPHVHEAASHFAVLAHCAALDDARAWVLEAATEIDAHKRQFAEELTGAIPELRYEPSDGTYLAWLDCSPLGLEHPGRRFHERGRLRFNFGEEFAAGASQFVRVNLATSPEIISEGVARMAASLT